MKTVEQTKEIEAHKERLEWLLEDRPKWACGEMVDLATKQRLIDQSRQILESHGIRHNAKHTHPQTNED